MAKKNELELRSGLWDYICLCPYNDGLRIGRPRVPFPAGPRDFSLLHCVKIGFGAYPASYTMGTGVSVTGGVKRPGRESNQSPSSAEVKNGGAMPPFPYTALLCGA
jgi:hypothetical protein